MEAIKMPEIEATGGSSTQCRRRRNNRPRADRLARWTAVVAGDLLPKRHTGLEALWSERADALLDARALCRRLGVTRVLLDRTLLDVAVDLVLVEHEAYDAEVVRRELRIVARTMEFWKRPWPDVPVDLMGPIALSWLSTDTKVRLFVDVAGRFARDRRLTLVKVHYMVSREMKRSTTPAADGAGERLGELTR